MSEELISTGECAKIKGISRQAINDAINRGEIPAVKVGRYFAIKREDCESYSPITPKERGAKGAKARWRPD